jgi:multidrug efflux system outer membrane protein
LQEIIIARAEAAARRGEYLPRLDAMAGLGVDRVGLHTGEGLSDERHGLGQALGDFSFGLRASWEVDVWGRLRTAANAAELRVRAAIEGRNFLVTQIVAEIARSYYGVAALDGQLAVLEQMIVLQQRALEMLRAEKQAARSNQLVVLRFEAELLRNRARIFDLRQRRVQAANRINFLLGRYPQPIRCADGALERPPPAALATGLPSALLDDRPDVRRAAAELEAAKLDVRAARARFYPSLSIDAAAGYRAFDPKHLLYTPDSMIANLAGNLVAPLLNRAGIEAAYRTASAQQVQAVLDYEQTLLRAFTEVANAVARL